VCACMCVYVCVCVCCLSVYVCVCVGCVCVGVGWRLTCIRAAQLGTLTVAALRALLQAHGVPAPAAKRKADLLVAVEALVRGGAASAAAAAH
jgi:hypothetical protein